jgi:hypothetical protein
MADHQEHILYCGYFADHVKLRPRETLDIMVDIEDLWFDFVEKLEQLMASHTFSGATPHLRLNPRYAETHPKESGGLQSLPQR